MLARPLRHSLLLAVLLAPLSNGARAATPSAAEFVNCGAAGCVPASWGPGQVAAGFGVGGFQPKVSRDESSSAAEFMQ